MPILLLIKAETYRQVKLAARQREVPIYNLAKNGGNLNEFRALTEDANALKAQKWFAEPGECRKGIGYPPGTLLFWQLID